MLFDCYDKCPAPSSKAKALSAETERRHGIDLKNPFTMSKTLTNRQARATAAYSGSVFSSSLGYGARRARVPVSRSKAAPYGRASQRWPFSLTLELVELIGIEPMT